MEIHYSQFVKMLLFSTETILVKNQCLFRDHFFLFVCWFALLFGGGGKGLKQDAYISQYISQLTQKI